MYWLSAVAWWTLLLSPPLVLAYRFLPRGTECPACEADTLAVRMAVLRPVRTWLTWRWCIACGWHGLARAGVPRTRVKGGVRGGGAGDADRAGPQRRDAAWERWLALAAVILLAAVCYATVKIGLAYAPPLLFGGLRALLAGTALLSLALWTRAPLLPSRGDVWSLVLLGVSATTVTYGAMFASPARMDVGLASVLGNVQPLLVLLLGAMLLEERLTRGKTAALLAGLLGVGLILYPSFAGEAGLGGSSTGGLLALGASAGAAIGSVLVKRIRVRPSIVALTGWQLIIGSAPLLAAGALASGSSQVQWTTTFVAVLLFLALLGTALPTTLWFWLLQDEDAGRLSMFLFLIPVLGLGLGVVAFGERIGILQAAGVLVIVTGLLFVSREMRSARATRLTLVGNDESREAPRRASQPRHR
jgi:drug/metabolite transporter (DMT)-like permease